jgi:ribosomal protein L20
MARRAGGTRRPKRARPVIDRLVDAEAEAKAKAPVGACCRLLGVSRQGYYRYRKRPTSSTQLRRLWLTSLIREVHIASRGTYGYRRTGLGADDESGNRWSSRWHDPIF